MIIIQHVPPPEELLLEILGPDVIEPCGGLIVDEGPHIDDICDVPLVVLMLLEELREISWVG